MTKLRNEKFINLINGFLLAVIVYLTHQTIFVWFFEFNIYGGSPQTQISLYVLLIFVILFILRLNNGERKYFSAWKDNWLVGLFVGMALFSMIWSTVLPATIYRALLVFFVAILGAYTGLRFSARDLVIFIAIVVGIFALASLFLALVFPSLGIHPSYPYQGLWRGIFWHKIYLGATMALGYTAYLVIIFSSRQQYSILQRYLAVAMIVVCFGLAILSDSASGLVVIAIQSGLFILIFCWLRWGHLIQRRVYWIMGGFLLLTFLLVIANLGLVFNLFNRNTSLTGRVPMWNHLLDSYVVNHPLVGYGFGAFWFQPGIMQQVQSFVHWEFPVRVSDNGYMDVLLGLGVVGLLLMVCMLMIGFWKSIQSALRGHDLTSFFPFFLIVHICFINISLSYFVENESFIWFLLVLILFMLNPEKAKLHPTE